MASKAKARESARTNPSVRLHDVLTALVRESASSKHNQRDVLCKLLRVPPDDSALLHSRLAELHRLPELTRRVLLLVGAADIYREWYPEVANAISQLSGSVHTNLGAFHNRAGLKEAITKLYMCREVLEDRDVLELQQLSEIREAIKAARAEVFGNVEIDPDLSDWLVTTLEQAEQVVEIAETVGVYAARDKIRSIVGGVYIDPAPAAKTEEEGALTQKAVEVFTRLAAAVLAQSVPEIAELISGKFSGLLPPPAAE